MKTKTLIQHFNEIIRDYQKHIGWDNLKREARDEIIQHLRERDELVELILATQESLNNLFDYLVDIGCN